MTSWPKTLFVRLLLILCVWLAAAQGLAFWVVMQERSFAVGAMMIDYVAKDIATAVALLERLPAAERSDWLPKLERTSYRYTLADGAVSPPADSDLTRRIVGALNGPLAGHAIVATGGSDAPRLRIVLHDGTLLTVHLVPPKMRIAFWLPLALAAQLAMLVLFAWFAVRIATRPLARLASAADSLSPYTPGTPLSEDGPHEISRTAAAFNAMQRRISEQTAERLQILAAVSHDLQTPITRMRLRAELLEPIDARERLLADLDAMQLLVNEGLAYARSAHGTVEPARAVDVHALLDSLTCDYTDAGQTVRLSGSAGATIVTRPNALKRIVTNLVDNALKFAGVAEIELLQAAPDAPIHIVVRDRGPGIPEAELQRVFRPFYRLEGSRNRDSGGTGLGLAIAAQLSATLGAELTLWNRPGGGLEARLALAVSQSRL